VNIQSWTLDLLQFLCVERTYPHQHTHTEVKGDERIAYGQLAMPNIKSITVSQGTKDEQPTALRVRDLTKLRGLSLQNFLVLSNNQIWISESSKVLHKLDRTDSNSKLLPNGNYE
jgi:hypothetical protein